jgi:hypothetical protein
MGLVIFSIVREISMFDLLSGYILAENREKYKL